MPGPDSAEVGHHREHRDPRTEATRKYPPIWAAGRDGGSSSAVYAQPMFCSSPSAVLAVLLIRKSEGAPARLAVKSRYFGPLGHTTGMTLTTRMLTPQTWDDFAALVEANNGVWGGCWCIGFHPEGVGHGREGNRELKRGHVMRGTVHQVLVYDGERCVGWCQFGPPAEVATIKNAKAYEKGLAELPDWLHLHQREGPWQGRSRCRGRGGTRGDRAGRRRRTYYYAWRYSAGRNSGRPRGEGAS
jgi:hypothetical protein